jgi:hypothetical protein
MFGDCAQHGAAGPLAAAAASGEPIEMENFFSRLGLDIIGKVTFSVASSGVMLLVCSVTLLFCRHVVVVWIKM